MNTEKLIKMFNLKTGLYYSELKRKGEEFIVNTYGMPTFFCSEDLKLVLMMEEDNEDGYVWTKKDIKEQIQNFKTSLSQI